MKIVEIYGPACSGKTTLMNNLVENKRCISHRNAIVKSLKQLETIKITINNREIISFIKYIKYIYPPMLRYVYKNQLYKYYKEYTVNGNLDFVNYCNMIIGKYHDSYHSAMTYKLLVEDCATKYLVDNYLKDINNIDYVIYDECLIQRSTSIFNLYKDINQNEIIKYFELVKTPDYLIINDLPLYKIEERLRDREYNPRWVTENGIEKYMKWIDRSKYIINIGKNILEEKGCKIIVNNGEKRDLAYIKRELDISE